MQQRVQRAGDGASPVPVSSATSPLSCGKSPGSALGVEPAASPSKRAKEAVGPGPASRVVPRAVPSRWRTEHFTKD